jgi:LDH2 family malate/lactate/ureidoglycolate dehydrogenase
MDFAPAALRAFCERALVAVTVPAEDAATIAQALIDANQDGIDTHGVSRLPVYIACLGRGRMNPAPEITLTRTAPSVGLVDGRDGLGLLVGVRAMRFAMDLARETGMGFTAAHRSSHCGAASYFCKMAAEEGMISMVCTNTFPAVPPWGGRTPYFGTNPIAFGFPGEGGRHVLVDMSSSVTARGKIINAAKTGKPIPEGWALDAAGAPTTDPAAALEGAILPMAGPKGYALALAVEILAGVLSGAALGPHVGWMYDDSMTPINMCHAFLALRVEALMPLPVFQARLDGMIAEIKATPLAAGHQAILIPGERKRQAAARRAAGVPLPDNVLAELDDMAKTLGIDPLPRA